MIHRLLGRSLTHRTYRDENAAFGFGTKLKFAVDLGKERVILADAHIASGMPFGAARAGNDGSGRHCFAAGNLQYNGLPGRVTSAAAGPAFFPICPYSSQTLASQLTCVLLKPES